MKAANFFLTFVFALFLDAIGAGVLAFLFGGTDKGAFFIFTLLFLVLAPAFLGAWSLLKFWLTYALFLKSCLIRFYLAELNKRGLPTAAGHYDADSYLSEVLESETEPPLVRAKAAFIIGELQAMASMQPFSLGIGARSAFENAMSQYHAAAKPPAYMSEAAIEKALYAELEEQFPDHDDPYFTPR